MFCLKKSVSIFFGFFAKKFEEIAWKLINFTINRKWLKN